MNDIIYTQSSTNSNNQPLLYVRKQLIKFPGQHIRVYNQHKQLLALCHDLPLRLRNKIEIYSDETKQHKILLASTKQLMDWNVTFIISEAGSNKEVGSLRRKGLKSSFLRDHWIIFDDKGVEIAELLEDSIKFGLLRRFLVPLPQKYYLRSTGSSKNLLTIKQNWLPWLLRYRVYSENYQETLQVLPQNLLIGVLTTIAVIEGRQR